MILRAATSFALALLGLATPALAESQPLAAVALDVQQLDQERGGFISAGGFSFDFGAELRTYVDGSLALQSKLSVTSVGRQIEQTDGSGALLANFGPARIVIDGSGGATEVSHDFDNGIRNIVANTASDRRITQDSSVTIILPQLTEMQANVQQQRLVTGLQDAVGLGIRDAAAH